ncbi:alpha-galactosidase a precursor [Parachaetomium inaequale]|uniref:Alpha-galactosidase a n=1 Tax=Parachaetomium inaequale TaxID=2588326 RepID=A0AAN6SR58_9PEZI|nr:alpha-galactosidase a precursor [Parachaetomium inaequale]
MSIPSPVVNSHVQLLAALVDFDDKEESEYRFLVDGRHVKYVTVDPGVLPKDDRTFAPVLLPLLPPFPLGDWNEGHISKDAQNGRPVFANVNKSSLPGVKNTWHPTLIDHLELRKLDRLRQNIHKVAHPRFDEPVLVKFAEFPWQIPYLEDETTVYQWIDGSGIGPKFLGHVTEEGRVIGFVMEYIDGARTATPDDLRACQRALSRLHALGIKHGDINKHNFVAAERDRTRVELDVEYSRLEG